MIVVSNTSPIFYLSCINYLELLRQLYGEIIIPIAVFNEITNIGNTDISATIVPTLTWIKPQQVTNQNFVTQLTVDLDPGEAEAIALAIEVNADRLIIDERLGRRIATQSGIQIIGVLGILIAAKQRNLIDILKPLLDSLIEQTGFWIDQKLYTGFCKLLAKHFNLVWRTRFSIHTLSLKSRYFR